MKPLEAFVADAPADYPVTYERAPGDGPLIECSIALGDTFDDIDIDPDKVVDRMRQEGITEDVIADTTVLFAADRSEHPVAKYLSSGELYGAYSYNDKTIVIFPSVLASSIKKGSETEDFPNSLGAKQRIQDYPQYESPDLDSNIARVLYHEIRHLRRDFEGVDLDQDFFRQLRVKEWTLATAPFVGTNIIGHPIAEYTGYNNAGISAAILCLSILASYIAVIKVSIDRDKILYRDKPSEIDANNAANEFTEPFPVTVRLKATNDA